MVPLYLAGSDVAEGFDATGDVEVAIERADLAFGPLYLCAGATAGDLCDTARLEWLDSAVVDTTDPEPVRVGDLDGTTGSVRSWMYDLGISSQLTRPEPYVLSAARELRGASFLVEGWASAGEARLRFSARVVVSQTETTELGVPVVRKGTEDRFVRDVTVFEPGLLVRFDPSQWLRNVDFRPYLDATAANEPLPAEVTLAPDDTAHRALSIALITSGRPDFQWGFVP